MAGKKYIIAIDLGTTGNRVFCFDEKGKVISSAYSEFTQYFPRPGWVEHDGMEIWNSICGLVPEAIKKGELDPASAVSIGITNQRETSILWDAETGRPIYHAIVWQCRRTADICNQLKERGHEEVFREKTGLVVDAYFSGTKIKWMFDNVMDARALAKKGRLRFGTIDTWILWKLTGGKSHVTDYTNASRTLIFDIKEKIWSPELCDILDIPPNILPKSIPLPLISAVQMAAVFFLTAYRWAELRATSRPPWWGSAALRLEAQRTHTAQAVLCSSITVRNT